jgi:hypothetical protein
MVMRRPTVRGIAVRYAVAWSYLIAVIVAEITYALLPSSDEAALLGWASTNVHNLRDDPAGSLVVSAFFPGGSATAWPVLIALALFGANRALGNWRTAVVCSAGHIIGTLVSEGILDFRVTNGSEPASFRDIIDVGPSYVVVAAIAVAILYGGWLARVAGVLDLVLLTFVGDIFAGLSNLDVAAVGHVTAITAGAVLGLASKQVRGPLRRRRIRPEPAGNAGDALAPPAPAGEAPAAQTRPPA